MSNKPVIFHDASVRANEVVANQKLAIGTSGETSELHIKAAAPEFRMEDNSGGGATTAFKIFADGGKTYIQSGVNFSAGSSSNIVFGNMGGGSEYINIGTHGLETTGNLVVNNIEFQQLQGLEQITNISNTTSNTLNTTSTAAATSTGTGAITCAGGVGVAGNVYVGSQLDVSGNVQVGTANLFVDTTTGYVGVGTTEPAKELEVHGTLRFSNASVGESVDLFMRGPTTDYVESAILTVSDGLASDEFGGSLGAVSLSADGSTALVSSTREDTYTGAVYIFEKNYGKWVQKARLTSSDRQQQDHFGCSVSISGDGSIALVGARLDDDKGTNAGAAYIFVKSGDSWESMTQTGKIKASDGAAYDTYGHSVSISQDGLTALIGSYVDQPYGAAYVYEKPAGGWGDDPPHAAKLTRTTSDYGYFGFWVSISGDGSTAVVGAPREDVGSETDQGKVYIYEKGSSWGDMTSATSILSASDGAANDYFGEVLSISSDGSTIVVGAYDNDSTFTDQGAAYIFEKGSGWSSTMTETAKLTASDGGGSDYFGRAVCISGDGKKVVVGAYGDDDYASAMGSVYIYVKPTSGSWSTTTAYDAKLNASGPAPSDFFGRAVYISSSGSTVLVGAFGDDVGANADQGAAYIFDAVVGRLSVSTSIESNGAILSFTGQHTCFPDGPMTQGLVVSANKNKYVSLNGPMSTGARAIKSSEALPVVSLSNVANDTSIFGVVDRFETGSIMRTQTSGATIIRSNKEFGDNRVIVNSLGEGAMWVVNTNGNLVSGDYITTSNVAGFGQKQNDDILHSYTVAKITMDCDFSPDDLPVQVIKKDSDGKNVLDTYGRIQWEDTDHTEKAYRIRYLTIDGHRTDQANAVWTAAYVGCTYHCG